ncbi:MAG: hypothetical protein A2X45_00130 [Lentisphaerae bacterium GWF2_50_93]|nr:MAG: hypothetical protein A2X45_00130 [Lentisphaerae bacterium GWF2_50_93]
MLSICPNSKGFWQELRIMYSALLCLLLRDAPRHGHYPGIPVFLRIKEYHLRDLPSDAVAQVVVEEYQVEPVLSAQGGRFRKGGRFCYKEVPPSA